VTNAHSSTAMFTFKPPSSPWRRNKTPQAHIYDSENEHGDDDSEFSNSRWQDKADTFEKLLQGALSLDERTGSLVSLESLPRAGAQRLGQLVGNKFGKENRVLTEDEELDASIASVESFRFEPQRCQAPTFVKVPKMNLFQSYEAWDNVLSNIFQSWENVLPDDASPGSMDKENLDPCVELERIRTLQVTAKHGVWMDGPRGNKVEEEKEDFPHATFHIDSPNAIITDDDGNTETTLSAAPSITNKATQSGRKKKKFCLFLGGRKRTTRETEQKRGESDEEGAVDLRIPECDDDTVESEAKAPQALPVACTYIPVDEPDDKNYCGRDLCDQSLVSGYSF
jgi:hypothetical protein